MSNQQKPTIEFGDAKPEPIIWICSWSKCRKISRAQSKNGYCQKCFEGTQIPFIQAHDYKALQTELASLKAENDVLKSQNDGLTKECVVRGEEIADLQSELASLKVENERLWEMQNYLISKECAAVDELVELRVSLKHESVVHELRTERDILKAHVEILKQGLQNAKDEYWNRCNQGIGNVRALTIKQFDDMIDQALAECEAFTSKGELK
jgi:cell division protein FtsB